MVIHKYINKLVNSFEKHVGTYIAPLKIDNKYILISLLFPSL